MLAVASLLLLVETNALNRPNFSLYVCAPSRHLIYACIMIKIVFSFYRLHRPSWRICSDVTPGSLTLPLLVYLMKR